MLIVIECADQALIDTKRSGDPIPLVALASTASINRVIELWICDVYFVWVDPDDGSSTAVSAAR